MDEVKNEAIESYPCWEDEIDLRELVATLLRWWLPIVLVTVVAAIAAFGFSTLAKPVRYRSSAMVLGTTTKAVQLMLPLAKSDAVVQQLYAKLDEKPEGVETYSDLKKYLDVKSGTSTVKKTTGLVLELSATASRPEEASVIANKWADIVVELANKQLRSAKEQDLQETESLFKQAEADLQAKEKALAEMKKEDKVAILSNELASAKTMQKSYLAKERSTRLLLQDVSSLMSRLEQRQGDVPSTTDDLAILALSLRSVGGSGNIQLQLQQASTLFSGNSMEERISYLKVMQEDLENRLGKLDSESRALDAKILGLQYELQKAQNKLDEAVREYSTASKNYDSFSAKYRAAILAAELPTDRLQVTTAAIPPVKPLPRRRLISAALAGVLGFMLAVFAVFVIEWWKDEGTD